MRVVAESGSEGLDNYPTEWDNLDGGPDETVVCRGAGLR